MRFEKRTSYQNDAPLLAELYELIAPSYASTGKHIIHDIELCDELYTLRKESGRLAAFFMVGYHALNGEPSCYLGLSACREELKGQRLVSQLYNTLFGRMPGERSQVRAADFSLFHNGDPFGVRLVYAAATRCCS